MAVDDSLKRGPVRPKSSIMEILGKQPAEFERDAMAAAMPGFEPAASPQAEGLESFDPESSDYKACGWAGNKTLPSLRFILKDQSEFGCSYAHLDTAHPGGCQFIPSAPGKGNIIRLRFAGQASVFMVVMEGTGLRRLWEAIMAHRVPWVHELPSGINFHGRDETVVRSITVLEGK